MSAAEIVLRRPELEAAFAANGALAVITGPGGSGKSYLLNRIATDQRSGWSGTAEFRRSDGPNFALHRALGTALSNGIKGPADIDRLGARLKAAADTLAVSIPREVAAIGLGRVLGALTAGLAPDVRGGVEALREELRAAGPEGLATRIEEATQASPYEQFRELAREVDVFAGERRVTVCLDRGELMSDGALDLLLDLSESDLGALRIVVAINSEFDRGKRAIDRFDEQRGLLEPLKLEPLRAEQLTQEIPGMTPTRATRLLRRGSKPIELLDALRLEEGDGDAVSGTPWAEALARRIRDASPKTRRAVFEFAVFPDRPDERSLALLAGGQIAVWEREKLLGELGLLTSSGGLPWFHELRRAVIVSEFVEELRTPAKQGLEVLAEQIRSSDFLLPAALDLAELAGAELEERHRVLIGLGADPLGVIGAFLELAAPGQDTLAASSLIAYAKAQWASQDPAAGIASLADRGLLVEDEDRPETVAAPEWDAVTLALVRARLLEACGRAPVPNLADMLVRHGFADLVRDAAAFRSRIGSNSMGALANLEATLRAGRERAPSLIVGADFRGVPLGIAARFEDEDQRDLWLERVSGQMIPIFGKWLSMGEAKQAPFGVQPAKRWSAAADALGVRFDMEPTATDGALTGEEAIAERLRLINRLKEQMLPAERQAANLDRPLAIGYLSGDDRSFEVELIGGRVGIVDISELRAAFEEGPRVMIRAEQVLPRVDEEVGRMSFTVRPGELVLPAHAAIDRIESRIAEFNRGQPPLTLPSENMALQELLATSLHQRQADIELLEGLLGPIKDGLPGVVDFHLCLSGRSAPPDEGAFGVWATSPRETPQARIHLQVPRFESAVDYQELVQPIGIEPEELLRVRTAGLLDLIALVLGHDSADLELDGPFLTAGE